MDKTWNENDVDLAERYAAALERIKELQAASDWTEEDVDQAERYLHTLQAIQEEERDADRGKAAA